MKWYILIPRRVTQRPIGLPSRSLKAAMAFRARVTMGFWPDIVVRSLVALSIALGLVRASPRPMLSTTFFSQGTCMTFWYPNSRIMVGTTSERCSSRSLGGGNTGTAGAAGSSCAGGASSTALVAALVRRLLDRLASYPLLCLWLFRGGLSWWSFRTLVYRLPAL